MQVRVGDIAAVCPACGASEFSASGGAGKLSCQSCGKQVDRAALMDQIGEKATREAMESLARLRKKRGASPER